MQTIDGYSCGDAYHLTGGTVTAAGQEWLVAVLLEGHRAGVDILVPKPEDVAKRVEQSKADWQAQQADFRKLHKQG